MSQRSLEPLARFGRWTATGLAEVCADPTVLDAGGRWAVAISFEGSVTLARFTDWRQAPPDPVVIGAWEPPAEHGWSTSLDQGSYCAGVERIREAIARGDVYQANLCRTLRVAVPPTADIAALHARLESGNPAPHSGLLRLPEHGVHIASASPELYLRRAGGRVSSRPIKGTGATAADLLPKDAAENVMIVDLVRNDLGRVCVPGTVEVPGLLEVEPHPGLVHLVSTVSGELRAGTTWSDLLAATYPPGSVTGAPKLAALRIIEALERGPRGPYCGAFGWVDAEAGTAELAVAIRTFWLEGDAGAAELCFGTGAGITWSSDPAAEWRETELKAAHLLHLAGAPR